MNKEKDTEFFPNDNFSNMTMNDLVQERKSSTSQLSVLCSLLSILSLHFHSRNLTDVLLFRQLFKMLKLLPRVGIYSFNLQKIGRKTTPTATSTKAFFYVRRGL